MSLRTTLILLPLLAVVTMIGLPDPALAYMGPGAGLGMIGTLFALVGAVLLAIVGFVWYPIKRMLRGRSAAARKSDTANE